MLENKLFIENGTYDNRKDLLIHYLKVLNGQNKPMTFSDLVLKNMPSGGMAEFESAMLELETKKWIIKTEEDGPPSIALPFLRTVDRRFSISMDGVEYLASIGIIEDKHKSQKDTARHSINNYGNMVYGDNPQGVNQLFDSISDEIPKDDLSSKLKLNFWKKIYKWTDHKLISMIVFAIIGFIISRLFIWLDWF